MRTGNRCKRAKGEEGEEERTSARMCKCIQMCTVLPLCNLYSSVEPCRNASMRVCECERWRFPGCSVKAWNALPRRKIPSHAVVNHQAGMSNVFCHFPNVHLSFAFLYCAPPLTTKSFTTFPRKPLDSPTSSLLLTNKNVLETC